MHQDESDRIVPPLPAFGPDGHVRRIRDVEADVIRLALVYYQWNCTLVAQRLGIGRGTLYRKIDELGIVRTDD